MKNISQKLSKAKVLVVAASSAVLTSAANAASATLPLTAQADIDGSITNGGTVAIGATLVAIGFFVILKMLKRI